MPVTPRRSLRAWAFALPVLLAACGGGGNDAGTTPPPIDCSVAGQQDWLRGYFKGTATSEPNYFWYGLTPPSPSPAGFTSVAAYFDALIYGGGDLIPNGGGARWPSDRYSGFQTTESFNRFFGAGRTLGYGVAVAGLEVTEPTPQPTQPLFVRYVERRSAGATAHPEWSSRDGTGQLSRAERAGNAR